MAIQGQISVIRSYREVIAFRTFKGRFDYLKLDGSVAHLTFGSARYLNQALYASDAWKKTRQRVIIRDDGCDLAYFDRPIRGRIYIHHINPITIEDIESRSSKIFNLDNLICCSRLTHEAIHYGDFDLIPKDPVERHAGDTNLW